MISKSFGSILGIEYQALTIRDNIDAKDDGSQGSKAQNSFDLSLRALNCQDFKAKLGQRTFNAVSGKDRFTAGL